MVAEAPGLMRSGAFCCADVCGGARTPWRGDAVGIFADAVADLHAVPILGCGSPYAVWKYDAVRKCGCGCGCGVEMRMRC